jgi:hypothetical protein
MTIRELTIPKAGDMLAVIEAFTEPERDWFVRMPA